MIGWILLPSRVWSQKSSPEREFNEAVAAQQSGDFAKALNKYRMLVRQFPTNVAVRVNLGSVLMNLGRLDDAIANYRAGLRSNSANLDLRFGLDAALIGKDDSSSLKSASADLERFRAERPKNLTATMLLAEVYSRQQRYALAVTLLSPFEHDVKDNDDFEMLLGGAMIQAGQLADGLERIDRVANKSGRADAYLTAGQARLAMSQFDLAQQDAEAAIGKQPDLPGAETLYGNVLERMGNYEGAEIALRKALTQDPEDFDANYDLGSLLYFNRDLPGASMLLEHALRLRPKSLDARYKLALVQQSRGESIAALKNLETVTGERPDWLEPHAKLSALYFQLSRPVDGAREAKRVEDLAARQQQVTSAAP